MKKLLVLAAALAIVLTVFAFPVGTVMASGEPGEPNTFIIPPYYAEEAAEEVAVEEPVAAPKTGDLSVLPQMMMAVASVGTLVFAAKKAK